MQLNCRVPAERFVGLASVRSPARIPILPAAGLRHGDGQGCFAHLRREASRCRHPRTVLGRGRLAASRISGGALRKGWSLAPSGGDGLRIGFFMRRSGVRRNEPSVHGTVRRRCQGHPLRQSRNIALRQWAGLNLSLMCPLSPGNRIHRLPCNGALRRSFQPGGMGGVCLHGDRQLRSVTACHR